MEQLPQRHSIFKLDKTAAQKATSFGNKVHQQQQLQPHKVDPMARS